MPYDNGNDGDGSELDFDPIPHFDASKIEPEAPEGGWDFMIPYNEIKKGATKPKENDPRRFPMLTVPIKLKRAHEEQNAVKEGAQLDFRIIVWPPDKPKNLAASSRELQQFCKAIGVDIGLFPKDDAFSHGSLAVLDEFIGEIEGKEGKVWTYLKKNDNGEDQTNLTFRKPKSSSSTASSRARDDEDEEGQEGEEEEAPPAKLAGRKGTASAAPAKPAKGTKGKK